MPSPAAAIRQRLLANGLRGELAGKARAGPPTGSDAGDLCGGQWGKRDGGFGGGLGGCGGIYPFLRQAEPQFLLVQ